MKQKKNPLIFWGIIALIIIMCLLVIVPMMTMRSTMADAVKQVNETYNDDFTMTWTDIDDRPMSDTFVAIMKSNTTGITYDAHSRDGVVTLDDFESENVNAQINALIEEEVNGAFAMSSKEGDVVEIRILTELVVAEDALATVAEHIKTTFDVTSVQIETLQITDAQLAEAHEQIGEYYQRSTVMVEETFDSYEPIRNTYNF